LSWPASGKFTVRAVVKESGDSNWIFMRLHEPRRKQRLAHEGHSETVRFRLHDDDALASYLGLGGAPTLERAVGRITSSSNR